MNLERNKNAARFVIGSISLLLISVGCGNAPEYRYQSAGDVTSTVEGGAEATSADLHANGHAVKAKSLVLDIRFEGAVGPGRLALPPT